MTKKGTSPAFTIIELLIVIVVVAILAAVSIVAYNGIQQRARASEASAALAQAKKKLELYKIDNGSYPSSGNLASAGITSTDVDYQYTSNGTTYCITGTAGTVSYKVSDTTNPTQGGCSGHGQGGVSAVTNLMMNPSAENGTATIGTFAASVVAVSDWSSSGSYSFKLTPTGTSQDSFFTIGGDLGAFRAGLEAGKTYTISTTIRLSTPLVGNYGGSNGSRQITAWYTSSTGSHMRVTGTQAPNTAGQSRQSVTYSIPSTATAAWLRFYHGGDSASGSIWFDDIMITEGSNQYNYTDGNSPNWVWDGVPNNSTSTGPPL